MEKKYDIGDEQVTGTATPFSDPITPNNEPTTPTSPSRKNRVGKAYSSDSYKGFNVFGVEANEDKEALKEYAKKVYAIEHKKETEQMLKIKS